MVFSECTGRDITTHRSAPAAGVWYEQLRTVWYEQLRKLLLPTHPAAGNNTELSGECLYYNPYLPGQDAMARPPLWPLLPRLAGRGCCSRSLATDPSRIWAACYGSSCTPYRSHLPSFESYEGEANDRDRAGEC